MSPDPAIEQPASLGGLRSLAPSVKTVFKLLISGGLVGWLVVEADTAGLRHALLNVDLVDGGLVVVLLFALTALLAWRWTIVARGLGVVFAFRPAWAITLIGAFFNQVLPSSVGGDAARVWRLRRAGLRTGEAVNTVVVDRMVALFGTVVIVVAGLPLLLGWIDEGQKRWAVALVLALAAAAIGTMAVLPRLPFARKVEVRRVGRAVVQLGRDTATIFRRPAIFLPALLLALSIHVGVSVAVWRLAAATDVDLRIIEAVFLVPLVILFSMIPITIAGWGVREGAMVVALSTVGIDRDSALAVSLLFGLANAVASLPGGLIWLITRSDRRHHSSEPPQGAVR